MAGGDGVTRFLAHFGAAGAVDVVGLLGDAIHFANGHLLDRHRGARHFGFLHALGGVVLVGLLVAADEGYITNVAVDPSRRRQGVAAQLLQVFDNFARGNQLAFLTLEVRPSNTAAIALYQGFGFREVGRRRNYYDLPKEDALILTKYYTEEAAQ